MADSMTNRESATAGQLSSLLSAGIPIGFENDIQQNPFIQPITELNQAPLSLASIKSAWIKRKLEESEAEFVNMHDLHVLVCTWNVDSKTEPGNLVRWLTSERIPDVIMVGLQEVDTSAEAYLTEGVFREDLWNKILISEIYQHYPSVPYGMIASKLYVGIYAAVFVREPLLAHIEHVSTAFTACGLMGMVGNKGAVSIRFRLFHEYICFISSHLAAHVPALERRNQDALEISRRTIFTDSSSPLIFDRTIDKLLHDYQANAGPASIADAGLIFWSGDLNYRVPLEVEAFHTILQTEDGIQRLVQLDQLNVERQRRRSVWKNFEEAPIEFPPTFKYDPGTSDFDTSEKNRTPAWCDRILFRSIYPVDCRDYSSISDIVVSDHKPVHGLFNCQVKTIDRKKFETVYGQVLKELDQFENAMIPVTQLQRHHIDIGTLIFRRLVVESTEILNVGQVGCQFQVIPKLDSSQICKPWIRIRPTSGILMPGESSQINFYFYADQQAAYNFNYDLDHVEDIIIIHVEGGRDHFVSVSGFFRKTSFCRPLSELSHAANIEDSYTGRSTTIRKVPTVVWLLVDFICKHGIQTENLFVSSGSEEDVAAIQDAIDSESNIPMSCATEMGVLSAGELLIRFLDCLPESVVPPPYYRACLDACENLTDATRIIGALPDENSSLWDYLVTFMKGYLLPRNQSVDTMELAYVFAPVLIKSSSNRIEDVTSVEMRRVALFFHQFIVA